MDDLISKGIITEEVFAQIGTSNYKPVNFAYTTFLSQEEFNKKVSESDIVVSHGASGSIMKALKLGKKIIAVTRLKRYGEHIDDHQIQINEAFGKNQYVYPVLDLEDFEEAYIKVSTNQVKFKKWHNEDKMAILNLINDFIKENWYEFKF